MKKSSLFYGALLLGLVSVFGYAQPPAADQSLTSSTAQNTSKPTGFYDGLGNRAAEAQSPVQNQVAKLSASDGSVLDNLGSNVAISGDTVVASAPRADGEQGAAYVFVEPATGWADATQTAKLTASDGSSIWCVAISGNTIVGAPPGGNVAYVFVEPPSGWANTTETAKLTASTGDGLCGFLAISGSTVVAGAPGSNGGRGAAYVFVEPPTGWANMTETAKLTSTDGNVNPGLGAYVAIDGKTVVAGAVQDGESSPGAAYVYVEPAGGWANMTQTAELTASDGKPGDFLGCTVGISGDTVVAGAPNILGSGQVQSMFSSSRRAAGPT